MCVDIAGDDISMETGLESSEESDIQSDDDLLLPDDSNHSKHAQHHDNQSQYSVHGAGFYNSVSHV